MENVVQQIVNSITELIELDSDNYVQVKDFLKGTQSSFHIRTHEL